MYTENFLTMVILFVSVDGIVGGRVMHFQRDGRVMSRGLGLPAFSLSHSSFLSLGGVPK